MAEESSVRGWWTKQFNKVLENLQPEDAGPEQLRFKDVEREVRRTISVGKVDTLRIKRHKKNMQKHRQNLDWRLLITEQTRTTWTIKEVMNTLRDLYSIRSSIHEDDLDLFDAKFTDLYLGVVDAVVDLTDTSTSDLTSNKNGQTETNIQAQAHTFQDSPMNGSISCQKGHVIPSGHVTSSGHAISQEDKRETHNPCGEIQADKTSVEKGEKAGDSDYTPLSVGRPKENEGNNNTEIPLQTEADHSTDLESEISKGTETMSQSPKTPSAASGDEDILTESSSATAKTAEVRVQTPMTTASSSTTDDVMTPSLTISTADSGRDDDMTQSLMTPTVTSRTDDVMTPSLITPPANSRTDDVMTQSLMTPPANSRTNDVMTQSHMTPAAASSSDGIMTESLLAPAMPSSDDVMTQSLITPAVPSVKDDIMTQSAIGIPRGHPRKNVTMTTPTVTSFLTPGDTDVTSQMVVPSFALSVQRWEQSHTASSFKELYSNIKELKNLLSQFDTSFIEEKEEGINLKKSIQHLRKQTTETRMLVEKNAKAIFFPVAGALVGVAVGGPLGLLTGLKFGTAATAAGVGGAITATSISSVKISSKDKRQTLQRPRSQSLSEVY